MVLNQYDKDTIYGVRTSWIPWNYLTYLPCTCIGDWRVYRKSSSGS